MHPALSIGLGVWPAVLARAVDYRRGTAVLPGVPNGVLRLP